MPAAPPPADRAHRALCAPPAHAATFSWATILIVVLIAVAAAPLVRHRRATAAARRPSRLREPAKIKHSDYYWRSRNLAHMAPQERISRGLPRCTAKKSGTSSGARTPRPRGYVAGVVVRDA